VSIMVGVGIGDGPVEGIVIMDRGRAVIRQPEVLGLDEPGVSEVAATSAGRLFEKCDLMGARTLSKAFLDDLELTFFESSSFGCSSFFFLAFGGFLGLDEYAGLRSGGV
jgi:hypothetical protein